MGDSHSGSPVEKEHIMRTKTVRIQNLKIATKASRARIRELAYQEFLNGATAYAAAKKLHVTAQTVSNWFCRFRKNNGRMFFESRRGPASGRGGLLDAKQRKRLVKVLTDKTPDQLKFDYALWSSKAIREYVKDAFHVDISRRTARRYMNMLGFTYKCPERRFREQSPAAVAKWLDTEYPAIKAEAGRCGARIMWGDETSNMAGGYVVRGYSPRGLPSVLRAPDPRSIRCSSISAIGNRGDLVFMFFDGGMNTDIFKEFCGRLIKDFQQPVFLIVDNLKVHHAKNLAEWFSQMQKEHGFRIFYLPSYSPELNPDEYFNRDIKAHLAEQRIPRSAEELRRAIERHVEDRRNTPEAIRRLFNKEVVKYAAGE